jgi:hypothetical protein
MIKNVVIWEREIEMGNMSWEKNKFGTCLLLLGSNRSVILRERVFAEVTMKIAPF